MNNKRKIAFITTARSDYNTMYPLMKMAQENNEIESFIIVAGMHTVESFGNTWRQIEKDNLKISHLVSFLNDSDDKAIFSKELANGTTKFTDVLVDINPDIVCVSGDRIENLSLFVSCTALHIPVAHMCGGDITEGAIDNQIRHVMTKLSHIHFVSMEQHRLRVIQMGEEPWRVHISGDAAIDYIKSRKKLSLMEIKNYLKINQNSNYFISTFHPQTLGDDNAVKQYENILENLLNIPEIPVMIYPNIDPGFEPLRKLLMNFQERRKDAIIKKNLDRTYFYSLMNFATFMIGNSSSGLWEAPSFELPAINVGIRQKGRVRGKNVIDVSGLNKLEIKNAINKARDPKFKDTLKGMQNPYGSGNASSKILSVLQSIPLDVRLFTKKFYEIKDFDINNKGENNK